jgi:hypothetical protein
MCSQLNNCVLDLLEFVAPLIHAFGINKVHLQMGAARGAGQNFLLD